MKRFLFLMCVSILISGCSTGLVQVAYKEYDNSIEYINMSSIHSSGWNKKEFTMLIKYPITGKKDLSWSLEIDCDKKLIRMSKDPSMSNVNSYSWHIIGDSPSDYNNRQDWKLYSLVCGVK